MAITHSAAANNAATDAVVDRIDLGAANATGVLRLKAGGTTVVDLVLPNPAFGNSGAVVAGRADLNAVTPVNAAAAGVVDTFQFLDRDRAVIFSGSVTGTGGGGDMTLDNTNVAAGQQVSVSSWTYDAFSA
jgi:hypothetical protein